MLSPEELHALVYDGDITTLAGKLADLSASERSKISKTASELMKGLSDFRSTESRSSTKAKKVAADLEALGSTRDKLHPHIRRALRAAEIAVLACCPLSTIKTHFYQFRYSPETYTGTDKESYEITLKAIGDRGLDWVDAFVDEYLTLPGDESRRIDWTFINELMKRGYCTKPTSTDYLHEIMDSYDNVSFGFESGAKEQFYHDLVESPGFLETDIYRIFDYDIAAYNFNKLIMRLVRKNKVDRDRIVECAIRSISNPFRQSAISRMLKIIERLEIDPAEWKTNLDNLIAILSSPVSTAITFAMKRLKELYQDDEISAERMLEILPNVFHCPKKSQPKTALTLIQQISKKHKHTVPLAIDATLLALDHVEADIQEKTLDMLEQWADRAHPDHASVIRDRIDQLPASIQSKAAAVADAIDGGLSHERVDATDAIDVGLEVPDLIARAKDIESPWREFLRDRRNTDRVW